MGSLFGAATMSILGVFRFSNLGIRTKTKKWENLEDKQQFDLSGRSYLVTGANSGIGFDTAYYLADHGATVHLLCRRPERGNTAADKIRSETRNSNVFVHIADLSEPKEVRDFCRKFQEAGNSLDVLINNAGSVGEDGIEYNSEGVEKTLASNTVGTFLLTNLLIPLLRQSSDPRVVTVATGGVLTQELLVRDDYIHQPLGKFIPIVAYARTKRHEVALTELWNEKFNFTGITFTSMHPGIVDTKTLERGMPYFYKIFHPLLRTWSQGSDTIKWLAVSNDAKAPECEGNFFRDRDVEIKHAPLAQTQYNHKQAEELWQWCCELAHWNEAEIKEPSA